MPGTSSLRRTTASRPRTVGDARERAIFLADASQALASSLDYERTLQTVARLAIPRFTDWTAVHLRQVDGSVRWTAAAHRDPGCERLLIDWYERHPLREEANEVIPWVLRTGQAAFHPSVGRRQLTAWTGEPDSRDRLETIGVRSIISVPLAVEEQVIGAITCVRAEGRRPFGRPDLALAEDLGRRAAVAIRHARLHEARQQAEEALRLEQARTDFALQAAQMGVWEVDLETGSIVSSASMGAVHGLTSATFPGTLREYPALVHPEERALVAASVGRAAAREIPPGHAFDRQFRIVWPDASVHWLQVKGQFVDRRLIRGIAMDITARRELEQRVQHAQKLEAVGRLASGLAHDFTNVLSAIMGYTEVILVQTSEADPIRADLQEVQAAAERAVQLTRQLLGFGRQRPWQPQTSNLNTAIAHVAALLTRLMGSGVELRTVLDPDIDPVQIDPGQFEQLLMNLAINARDAMPDGGLLTIATAMGEAASGAPAVILSVQDTGVGMDEATRAKIFEPFFSTKGEKGTGLGLATVYGAVQQSHGEIAVTSEPGRGTRFEIRLPAVPIAEPQSAADLEPQM